MSDGGSRRLAHLGKLSVAILENLTKPVQGEAGLKELKAPVVW